jgi:hypothetical protein
MGVYAQTSFEITCKTKKDAQAVAKKLKELTKKSDQNSNSFGRDIEVDGNMVYGNEDSGRIQNLEWRCEVMWNAIKDLGVVDFNCPFMSEADGYYQSNEN